MASEEIDTNRLLPFCVLCSVYIKNSPEQVDQAIRSIWTEQSVKPSQIVIVQDGMLRPDTEKVIHNWKNKLPNIFTLAKLNDNHGLGFALNYGLKFCNYQYVARMDADDISLPDRFKKQIRYLASHPNTDVLGAQVEEWDDNLIFKIAEKKLPLSNNELIKFSKFRCPLNHPTVVFKKTSIIAVGGYPCQHPEDFLLWIKLIREGYVLENLDSILVKMRSGDMLAKRRGSTVLIPELKLFCTLYKIGHINILELLINCCGRIILRLSPSPLRVALYKRLR